MVDQTDNHRITCKEFKDWVEKYDDNGVFEETTYPLETIEKAVTANIILTSDLKSSIDSAHILNKKVKILSLPIFRETELPAPFTKISRLKLSPNIWAVVLRCLWFIGYSRESESFSNAKKRAAQAAKILVEHAQEHQSVALVGHGFINMLIAKELIKMGWIGKRKTSAKHWQCTTYLVNPALQDR